MKKLRKFLATPGVSLCAIALGVLLLGTSTVGGARAALLFNTEANPYTANMQLNQIKVELKADEGDKDANKDDLLGALGSEPKPGVAYPEKLWVQNPETTDKDPKDAVNIDEYVRVTIRRYWVKTANGVETKQTQLDPSLIELKLGGKLLSLDANADAFAADGWIEDKASRTAERIVLYYQTPITSGGKTNPFCDSVTISPSAALRVDAKGDYLYNGMEPKLEVTVDAIQNNHADEAALSAWGAKLSMSGDTITSIG